MNGIFFVLFFAMYGFGGLIEQREKVSKVGLIEEPERGRLRDAVP